MSSANETQGTPPRARPVVCCIGTTDPWNAAGLGLDLLALRECGAAGVTVVAAVSAQSRRGIAALEAVSAGAVAAQLAGLADAEIAAYRIGALADVATIETIARHIEHARVPVVYDPALGASGGGSFSSDDVVRAIVARLLPRATIVTPNLREAAILTGEAVDDVESMARAGARLVALGARAALVKGGHLAGRAIDVLVTADASERFEGERIAGELRGTGCLLAAALAAGLARGCPLDAAVADARAFVRARFASAVERGGMRLAY